MKKAKSKNAARACQSCEKIENLHLDRNAMKAVCGGCRDVLKADLVIALLGEDVPILTKEERYNGRKNPLSKQNKRSVIARYKRGESMMHLAEYYEVSYGLVNKIIPKNLHRKVGRYKKKRKRS